MNLTKYEFSYAINSFFEYPISEINKVLPKHLKPVEVMPGIGIFSIILFEFTKSEVGHYHELVLAFNVYPFIGKSNIYPSAAFYPFLVATSSCESRNHAIEKWHLPHWMNDSDFNIEETDETNITVEVRDKQANKILRLIACRTMQFTNEVSYYQSLMIDETANYLANINIAAHSTENEEQLGN